MTPRVTKEVAATLIPFIKNITLTGRFWDPYSKSAYEFYRQMNTKKVKKINPNIVISFTEFEDPNQIPTLKAEFIDGTKLEIPTKDLTSADLRYNIFSFAEEVEDKLDDADGDDEEGPKKGGDKKGKK
ncbi:hypothetical protein EON65_11615 [archaeon]|nr:MAG: hypothetical protein EON65_11615 [archaeon]